jgi:hypothetical protein
MGATDIFLDIDRSCLSVIDALLPRARGSISLTHPSAAIGGISQKRSEIFQSADDEPFQMADY